MKEFKKKITDQNKFITLMKNRRALIDSSDESSSEDEFYSF